MIGRGRLSDRRRLGTITVSGWLMVVMGATALLAVTFRCGDRPSESSTASSTALPPENRPATKISGQELTGTAPAGSIITLEPLAPRDFPIPHQPAEMDQTGRSFMPSVVVARQGQPVLFRNSDDEIHNVRVTEARSGAPVFNVATTSFVSYTHTFDRAGFYTVTCDIHSEMRADVLITATPYAAVADRDGHFTLSDLSPGSYTLTAYAAGKRLERIIEITSAQTELTVAVD